MSTLCGVVAIARAVMRTLPPVAVPMAALGSAMAVLMFLTTLSFLFIRPG